VTNEVTQDLINRVEKLEQDGPRVPSSAPVPARARVAAEQPVTQQTETPIESAPAAAKTPPPRPKVSTTPPPMKPSQVTAAATQKAEEQSAQESATLTGPVSFEQIRDAWPAVLQALGGESRVAGIVMADTAPVSLGDDKVLAVAFPNVNTMNNAVKSGHDDRLRLVIQNLFHTDVRIDPTVDPNRAKPAKPKKDTATDAGEASPDDETIPSRSSIDIITSSLGGQVISESPREA
jgi:DNA polymerase-3 subunit gamma/tau